MNTQCLQDIEYKQNTSMNTNAEIAIARLGLSEEESRTILKRATTRALSQDFIVVKKGFLNDYLYIIFGDG